MRRKKGRGNVYLRGRIWWVRYSFNGRPCWESSRSEKESDAWDLLEKRRGEIQAGEFTGPKGDKVTIRELAEGIRADYRMNNKKSIDKLERVLKHLFPALGHFKAHGLTTAQVKSYIVSRQAEGAENSTINRESAALKRMYVLGIQDGKIKRRPHIPMLEEPPAREGFFEEDEFRAVLENLPEDIRPVAEFAYLTGWRVKSEVLPLQWRQVDFRARVVRLDPGTTKNKDGRTFPFAQYAPLRDLLEGQRERTEALDKTGGMIVPWVFHRGGKPIRSFRKAWATACESAGFPGKILHDFRRTAVRNLERAGVPRSVAMKLVGHKTEAIYRRYAIVSEADLSEGVAKLARLQQEQEPREDQGKVISLKTAQAGAI